MAIANIALGLVGLGIVVFAHELGHFVAARLAGIDVEAFSIGWGSPILKRKIRGVEYRLGMFPVGGYCKMRGHDEIKGAEPGSGASGGAGGAEASGGAEAGVGAEAGGAAAGGPPKGSFYAAGPLRRIGVCAAGPVFNVIFAVAALSAVWGLGFERHTQGNKIVLASDLNPGAVFPADEAGLMTGDRIVAINGRPTMHAHEIREAFMRSPNRLLELSVDRGGEILGLYVRPELDRSTGAGVAGVGFWVDPVVAGVVPDGAAAIAGLLPGDRIVRVNGIEVAHQMGVARIVAEAQAHATAHATVDFVRGGAEERRELLATHGLGIVWPSVAIREPALSPPAALARGARETWRTLAIYVHGISLLFRGVNLAEAVSGPLRITYMVGDVATSDFARGGAGAGLRSAVSFLAFISIALGIMNMLPLPVLDGGQIVLYAVEMARGKPTPPRALKAFQTVGVALIFGLMLFALFGDIRFLGGRLGLGQ